MENQNLNPDALEQLMAETAEKLAAKKLAEENKTVAKGEVTMEALGQLFASFMNKVDEKIAKAVPAPKAEDEDEDDAPVQKSVGRKGTVAKGATSKSLRDENPLQYIVSKARAEGDVPAYKTYDTTDKAIIWALTRKALAAGMVNEATNDEQEIDFDNL